MNPLKFPKEVKISHKRYKGDLITESQLFLTFP